MSAEIHIPAEKSRESLNECDAFVSVKHEVIEALKIETVFADPYFFASVIVMLAASKVRYSVYRRKIRIDSAPICAAADEKMGFKFRHGREGEKLRSTPFRQNQHV